MNEKRSAKQKALQSQIAEMKHNQAYINLIYEAYYTGKLSADEANKQIRDFMVDK